MRATGLEGGYGTTGASVVFSIPLEHIDLDRGDSLHAPGAFTATGSYDGGPVKILDRIDLQAMDSRG